MFKSMPKHDYLADLQARNRRNRGLVEITFTPLGEAARSSQPAPGEWSVDQCFQHLILAFEMYVHNVVGPLNKPEPVDADGLFRTSWWARRTLEWQFNPKTKLTTLKRTNPAPTYIPDILALWLAQQERLAGMIAQAGRADLQTMCWFFKGLPIRYNLGDYLNFFVSHDELHIGQAQRALAAYRQQAERVPVELSAA